MSERATVFQRPQLGVEVTAGTGVAANRRLHATYIEPQPMGGVTPFRPAGAKFNSDVQLSKEHTEAAFSGVLAWDDIVYLLESALLKTAGPTANIWTWMKNPNAPDVPQTYSLEVGSSAGAEKFVGAFIRDIAFRFTQTEVSVDGVFVGKTFTPGITMTVSPADVVKVPVDPKLVDVYIGADVAGLAKITRASSFEFGARNIRQPAFFFDSTEDSYATNVESTPDITATLRVASNSVANTYLADLRAKTQRFCRVVVTGPIFTGATVYRFQLTFPFKFAFPAYADADAIRSGNFPLLVMNDSTFGGAFEIKVTTGLASL